MCCATTTRPASATRSPPTRRSWRISGRWPCANTERSALAHAIVTVKHGKKVEAWEIDAISGATVTSRAVGKALNDSAQVLVPAVQRQLTVLTRAPQESP